MQMILLDNTPTVMHHHGPPLKQLLWRWSGRRRHDCKGVIRFRPAVLLMGWLRRIKLRELVILQYRPDQCPILSIERGMVHLQSVIRMRRSRSYVIGDGFSGHCLLGSTSMLLVAQNVIRG